MSNNLFERLAERGNQRGADRVLADAVAALDDDLAAPLDLDRPGHLGALAMVAAAVVGIAVWAALIVRDNGVTEVDTGVAERPAPRSDSVPAAAPSSAPGLDLSDLLVPPLLPDSEQWVVIGGGSYPAADSTRQQSSIWAFDYNGKLVILISQARTGDEIALSDAEVAIGHNRVSMWWTDGFSSLGLEGFDMDAETLTATAAALERTGDGWNLPGAELLASELGGTVASVAQHNVELARLRNDGTVDLTTTVDQYSSPGSVAGLYRILFEASSLGVTAEVDIDGGTGYVIAGGELPYALVHHDGFVTNWQSLTPDLDLTSLIESLEPASSAEWQNKLKDADRIRQQAIDEAAQQLEPIKVEILPRYVLPEPWQLESVDDRSLWTEEERLVWRAQIEAQQGRATARLVWEQTFAIEDNPAGSVQPDVVIEVWEYDGWPPEVTVNDNAAQFTIDGFDGYISTDFIGRSVVSIRDATFSVEITSPTLSLDELANFAQGLVPRSGTASDGFDRPDSALTPGLDAAFDAIDWWLIPSWHAEWVQPGRRVTIDVQQIPRTRHELLVAAMIKPFGATVETIDGITYVQTPQPRGLEEGVEPKISLHILTWYNPDLGVEITIRDDGDPSDIAAALQQIDEPTWVDIGKPLATPPPPTGGN